jgi:hypothetical protein
MRAARQLRRLSAARAFASASENIQASGSEGVLPAPEIILSATPTPARAARRVHSIHNLLRPRTEHARTSTSGDDNERPSNSTTPPAMSEDGAARPTETEVEALGEPSTTPKRKHTWRSKKIRRQRSA